MFGLEQVAISGIAQYRLSEKAIALKQARREVMKESLTAEEFDKWEKQEIEERRHQEICDAIRATKPDPIKQDDGIGMAGLIFGACVAGSIARD